jgi:hypothetical protein
MNRLMTISLCWLSSSALSSAQAIDVTGALRAVESEVHGFDYEYDDGLSDTSQSTAFAGDWNAVSISDLVDYWGFAVGTGTADQQSSIEATALALDCEATATTAGNHFSADSRAECSFEVSFQLAERARFDADFFAESTLGYNTARVELAIDQGPTLRAVVGDYGTSDALLAKGWLPAGDYVLRASCEAFAYGSHNQPDAQVGRCSADLRTFHELDYHMDGRVTRIDRRDFRRAYLVGHPSADFDENGVTNLADWIAYRIAYLAY